MRFAIVDKERREAAPKLKGFCAECEQPVTAKCGKQRIWHWSHKSDADCSKRWEPETEWHRTWKDEFPLDWQEKIQHAQSGEKHIADVQTAHGLVIEFQHSPLDPQERIARESFYKNMVWVVDGSRLKNDYKRLRKGKKGFIPTNKKKFFLLPHPDECFPVTWLESRVPVVFDFSCVAYTTEPDNMARKTLWYLHPVRMESWALVVEISRDSFKSMVSHRSHFLPDPALIRDIEKWIWKRTKQLEQKHRESLPPRRYARF